MLPYVPLNSVCQKGRSRGLLRSLPANPKDPGEPQAVEGSSSRNLGTAGSWQSMGELEREG